MKRLILVWVMILCLVPLGAWAAGLDQDVMALLCSENGAEEFMAAVVLTRPKGNAA